MVNVPVYTMISPANPKVGTYFRCFVAPIPSHVLSLGFPGGFVRISRVQQGVRWARPFFERAFSSLPTTSSATPDDEHDDETTIL